MKRALSLLLILLLAVGCVCCTPEPEESASESVITDFEVTGRLPSIKYEMTGYAITDSTGKIYSYSIPRLTAGGDVLSEEELALYQTKLDIINEAMYQDLFVQAYQQKGEQPVSRGLTPEIQGISIEFGRMGTYLSVVACTKDAENQTAFYKVYNINLRTCAFAQGLEMIDAFNLREDEFLEVARYTIGARRAESLSASAEDEQAVYNRLEAIRALQTEVADEKLRSSDLLINASNKLCIVSYEYKEILPLNFDVDKAVCSWVDRMTLSIEATVTDSEVVSELFHIPTVTSSLGNLEEVGQVIQNTAQSIVNENIASRKYTGLTYTYRVTNGEILSVVLSAPLVDESGTAYWVYNINLRSGEFASTDEVLYYAYYSPVMEELFWKDARLQIGSAVLGDLTSEEFDANYFANMEALESAISVSNRSAITPFFNESGELCFLASVKPIGYPLSYQMLLNTNDPVNELLGKIISK